MKVKYQQLYSNECGICALKNLLSLYKIKTNENFNLTKEGISAYQIKQWLSNYFKNAIIIKCDLIQFSNTKKLKPFILLIKINNSLHYIVIYKYKNYKFYVLDSLYKTSYKIRINDLISISKNIIILGDY